MKKNKQPYQKPRITSGEVFDQASLQACEYINSTGGCGTYKAASASPNNAASCGGAT